MLKTHDLGDNDQFDADKDCNPHEALIELRRDYKRNEEGHRENIWRLIERAATTCKRLMEDPEDIDRFINDRFWSEKPYKPRRSQILLHCMQYMVNAPHSNSKKYNTASDYAKAVQILERDSYQTNQIFAQLKTRGGPYAIIEEDRENEPQTQGDITKVADNQPANRSNNPNVIENVDFNTRSVPKTGASRNLVTGAAESSEDPQKSKTTISRRSDVRRVRMFDPEKHIALTGNDYKKQIMEMEIGESYWVKIERTEDEGNVYRFDIISIDEDR